MFKIGEFSRLTQVSVRMLRYYDENDLLRPAAVDSSSGYRLYSATQIPQLNRILFLRNLGLSVQQIRDALLDWRDESIDQLLDRQCEAAQKTISNEQRRLQTIQKAKDDLAKQTIALHCNVTITSVPATPVFSLRRRVESYFSEGILWQEMSAYAKEHRLPLSEPDETFSLYHDADYRERDVDIEVCVRVPELLCVAPPFASRHVDAVPLMASTMVYGPFENINASYLAFAAWLEAHPRYVMSTPTRQIVHRGPWNEEDPTQYLTRLQIPLCEKENFLP